MPFSGQKKGTFDDRTTKILNSTRKEATTASETVAPSSTVLMQGWDGSVRNPEVKIGRMTTIPPRQVDCCSQKSVLKRKEIANSIAKKMTTLRLVVAASSARTMRRCNQSAISTNVKIGRMTSILPQQFHEKEKKIIFDENQPDLQFDNEGGDDAPPFGLRQDRHG
jgi:hypothetical protein